MLNSDLPIKKTEEDALNRTCFVKSLAQTMLDYTVPEGFVIGMYGKWGSGKTSVINMLLETLEQLSATLPQKPVILKFNPWLFSDSRQLITQFFKQLSSAIKLEQPRLSKVCHFINEYAYAFDIAEAVPIAGGVLSAAGKILGKKAKDYSEARNADLQRIKNEIKNTLQKEQIKIIVTIDDIDRLSNREIISVFQLVKSLADFPNTLYLLAFDRDVIIRALQEVQQGDGAEYLEKIIQVPFELPAPDPNDIHEVLFSRLHSLIDTSESTWDKEYWGEMFYFGIRPYLKSIRDVVRYTNTFALKYSLLKEETHTIDLLGVTCLQVFEPDIYSRLPHKKELLCGGNVRINAYEQMQREQNELQQACDYLFTDIPEERAENSKSILTRLFPKLSAGSGPAFDFQYLRPYNHYEALANGSIACPECFDRYFSLTLEASSIPQQFLRQLLFQADAAKLTEGLMQINASRKINRFLDHVSAAFRTEQDAADREGRARLIFKVLLQCWHHLDDDKEDSPFSIPFDWRLLFAMEKLLKPVPECERCRFLSSCFQDTVVDISTLLIILRELEKQHNRLTEDTDKEREKLVTLNELAHLENLLTGRIIAALEEGTLLDNRSAHYAIWFLEKLEPEKAKTYTPGLTASDRSLAKLISATVRHSKETGREVSQIWSVRKDDMEKYIDINTAYKRIITFICTDDFRAFPLEQKENIAAFLIEMERTKSEGYLKDYIYYPDIEKKLNEMP